MRHSSRPWAVVASAICLISTAQAQSSNLDSLIQPHITTRPTVVASSAAPTTTADLSNSAPVPAFDVARKACPLSCSDVGSNPANWTVYHSIDRLSVCKQPMLLDFAIHNPLDDAATQVSIRTCSNSDTTYVVGVPTQDGLGQSCVPAKNALQVQASLQMAWIDATSPGNAADAEVAAQQMLRQLSQQEGRCNATILFASYGATTIGLYAGSQIHAQGIDVSVLEQFISQVGSEGISDTLLLQHCSSDQRGADYAVGIVGNVNAGLPYVQNVVKTWSTGECITEFDGSSALQNITFWAPKPATPDSKTNTTLVAVQERAVQQRATCSTIQVVSMDTCTSLATKCGVTSAAFTTYNPGSTFCSTLAVGQHVCCSAGTLPNLKPNPNPDGSCASYLVPSGAYCSMIASSYGLQVSDLESFNTNTWGWAGCDNLQAGMIMCLSTGTPPMPAPLPGTVCGPQVPGTSAPASGQTLASLNPCPLNACCDIWGQCGITIDFCVATTSSTGAPGTSAPGTNGCISNCGTNIIIGSVPETFRKVGYFEAFNNERPCLNMNITSIDKTKYTHVHLAFAAITSTLEVDVSGIQEQFDLFVTLTGIKKVLSFGGWSFSTGQDTIPIFQSEYTNDDRNQFIANIVEFVIANGIDGVDFDWEYPGATDIPGLPPGSPIDGLNYFVFLYHLKEALPAGVTVSMSAPASFWYLKGFPIKAMSEILDYIIYMTYDLHGQWDYGSTDTNPGCPGGNCLRSHVNFTETLSAMSMITKAGVDSAKVLVGVSSYGRGFQMTTPGCTGPTCTFTGPDSGATPGNCTQTAGYLANGEIDAIISAGGNIQTYYDNSQSNILVYNNVQWVAYMNETTKAARSAAYQAYHFGGTTDWAVDLQ